MIVYKPTFPLVSFNIFSLKDFQDAQLAERVLQAINEAGNDFIPDTYGADEVSAKTKYDPAHHEPLIRLWTDERDEATDVQRSFASAWFLMKKKRKPNTCYQMRWKKDQEANFNYLTFSLNLDYLRKPENWERFMNLSNHLLLLLEPVQANIWNLMMPEWSEPIDLQVRHPELGWINYFGKPYIDLFGREKLLSAPCYRTFEIGEDIIGLQMSEDLFQPIPSDVRYAVKKHLGEDAFVEEGKWYRYYKTGRIPAFDFSGVLHDPSKPIEGPKIWKRGPNGPVLVPKSS